MRREGYPEFFEHDDKSGCIYPTNEYPHWKWVGQGTYIGRGWWCALGEFVFYIFTDSLTNEPRYLEMRYKDTYIRNIRDLIGHLPEYLDCDDVWITLWQRSKDGPIELKQLMDVDARLMEILL